MDKVLDLKHWAFALMLIFASKIAFLTMTNWMDFACLVAAFVMFVWAKNKSDDEKEKPKMEAYEEIREIRASMALETQFHGELFDEIKAEMTELRKVTDEAKKLISQTNITAAFVPRRARGE